MKVFVTGAAGFIGKYVVQRLLQEGWKVYALSRSNQVSTNDDLEWVKGDLFELGRNQSLAKRLKAIEASHLLHLSWNTEHGKFWDAEDNFLWVEASMVLLRIFREAGGQKAVLAGTCAEYDWAYGYCRENATPCEPSSVYGTCKNALNALAQGYCDATGMDYCWGRVFSPYGSGEPLSRLVPHIIQKLIEGKQAECTNGNLFRDFLHVEDVASAFVTLLGNCEAKGALNICSGEATRIRDVANRIGSLLNREELITYGSKRSAVVEFPLLLGDNDMLRSCGWSPQVPLNDGLIKYIDDLKKTGA